MELREERRTVHRAKEEYEGIDQRVENKILSKWFFPLVGILLTVIGWFAAQAYEDLKKQQPLVPMTSSQLEARVETQALLINTNVTDIAVLKEKVNTIASSTARTENMSQQILNQLMRLNNRRRDDQ